MTGSIAAEDRALAALAQFFVNDGTIGDTLHRVAELAREMVGPADLVGLTLMMDGRPATGVFTDPVAPDIDAAQYRSGHGPCLDAFRDQRVYRIDSTSDDDRWPQFAADAAAHGVRATLSVPVAARGEGMGALNLYSRTTAFTDRSVLQAEVFARHAAVVLSNTQAYLDARQLSDNLQQAMQSRATIDHAIGILMADGGRSPEEAFELLVLASQRENRKLRDIAADMVRDVTRRARPAPAKPAVSSPYEVG